MKNSTRKEGAIVRVYLPTVENRVGNSLFPRFASSYVLVLFLNKVFVLPSLSSNEGDSLTQQGSSGQLLEEPCSGEVETGTDSAFRKKAEQVYLKALRAIYRSPMRSLLEGFPFGEEAP